MQFTQILFRKFVGIYVIPSHVSDLLRTFHKLGLIYDLSGRAAPFPLPPPPAKGRAHRLFAIFAMSRMPFSNGFMKLAGNGFYWVQAR